MCSEIVYIAGRYNKYLRNLSQSPWIDKDDVRIKNSVQELIEDGFKKYLQYERTIFSSSGREDVDVRMLGKGRPFVFKMVSPFNDENYNLKTMRKIQNYVNKKHATKIEIRDLQVVSKEEVANHIKEGEESKTKEYRALCCCSRKISQVDIDKVNTTIDLDIEQKTPIRVLHRRTLASRRRRIYKLRLEPVKVGDFDSVKEEYLDNLFTLTLLTEAGTYIKEFVHGDFGRTKPSLSDLLGDCDTDLMELDVMVSICEQLIFVILLTRSRSHLQLSSFSLTLTNIPTQSPNYKSCRKFTWIGQNISKARNL